MAQGSCLLAPSLGASQGVPDPVQSVTPDVHTSSVLVQCAGKPEPLTDFCHLATCAT